MSMKMKRPPLGVSDFKDMVTGNYYYVDKTLFIKEIIDKGDKILLIPRPRRFNKYMAGLLLKSTGQAIEEFEKKGQSRKRYSIPAAPAISAKRRKNHGKQYIRSLGLIYRTQSTGTTVARQSVDSRRMGR